MNQTHVCNNCGVAASASAQWCADCGSTAIVPATGSAPPSNWAPPTSATQQAPAPAALWAAPPSSPGQWATSPAGYSTASAGNQQPKAGVFGAAIALVWSVATLLRTVLFVEGIVDRRTLGFTRLAHPGSLFGSPRFMLGNLNSSLFGQRWWDHSYLDPRTLVVLVIGVIAFAAFVTRSAQMGTVLMISLAVYVAGIWLLGVDTRGFSLSLRILLLISALPVLALVVSIVERASGNNAAPAPAYGPNVF